MSNQIEFFAIPNPCQRKCETDRKGYCLTCYRSRQERFDWQKLTDEQKRDVIRLCKQRALRKRYAYNQQYKQQVSQLQSNDNQMNLFD